MNIVTGIWHRLVNIFGTVVCATALIAWIVYIIERTIYKKKSSVKSSPSVRSSRNHSGGHHIAIITGASSGLGANFVRNLNRSPEKYDVDEVWLIARRKDRLEKLAEELSLPAKILPMDLTSVTAVESLGSLFASRRREDPDFSISVLINCAGYGKYGTSSEIGHKEECRMMEVNDGAAIRMTNLSLPYMHAGSHILQVCSVAAFQPIPRFNAYAATKAMLYTYSRGLRLELLSSGISVTALCPYWIHDTEFIETASGKKKKPFLSTTSAHVARVGLRDMLRRQALSTPDIISTLDRIFAGLIPDEVLGYITGKFL